MVDGEIRGISRGVMVVRGWREERETGWKTGRGMFWRVMKYHSCHAGGRNSILAGACCMESECMLTGGTSGLGLGDLSSKRAV